MPGTSKTKSSKKPAKRKSSRATQAALTITMTPKQRAQLKELTKGKVDAQTIQIRQDIDVSQFLSMLVKLSVKRPVKGGGIAPPPKDTYWV